MKEPDGVRERALALFLGRARRALGLRHEVCVLITSNHEVQELNRRHRRKDQPTDVLSFGSVSPQFADDVAISADIAASNAGQLGHSTETELKILILHGLLHLAGYDHEKDNGQMRAREAELRQRLKLPVGLIERTHATAQQRSSGAPKASAARSGARRR